MKEKKWVLLALGCLLILLGIVFFLSRGEYLSRKAKVSTLDSAVFSYQDDGSGFLTCKLLTSQIKNQTKALTQEILVLRSTECIFNSSNNDVDFVTVPLAYYNTSLKQLYIVGDIVSDGDMPGDAYIDNTIKFFANDLKKDSTVHLYAVTDFSKNDVKFKDFFKSMNISKNWDAEFVRSANQKYLPEMENGDKFFFTTGITYVSE